MKKTWKIHHPRHRESGNEIRPQAPQRQAAGPGEHRHLSADSGRFSRMEMSQQVQKMGGKWMKHG